jgi:hypothetical protein
MSLREKVAHLLDAIADERDRPTVAVSAPKASEPVEDPVSKLASHYQSLTGEDLSEELREQLAQAPALQEVVAKLAAPQRPTPMGDVADRGADYDESRALKGDAAVKAAHDRFGSRIIAIGQKSR